VEQFDEDFVMGLMGAQKKPSMVAATVGELGHLTSDKHAETHTGDALF